MYPSCFKKAVEPKLDNEATVDMSNYFADWAPKRLKLINRAFRDTTYEALRAESRDMYVSYNGLKMKVLAELRTNKNCIRPTHRPDK